MKNKYLSKNIFPMPKYLIDRKNAWKDKYFKKKVKVFKKLALDGQKPSTLVVTCCDSRIDVMSIFNAEIGEFFIHKNIANLIPAFSHIQNDFSTQATLEFAVLQLKVKHIIVMGHSNCGGIKAGYDIFVKNKNTRTNSQNKYTKKWLKNLKPCFKNFKYTNKLNTNLAEIEKASIINSIENIFSYSSLKKAILKKNIKIHGLWYEIEKGDFYHLEKEKLDFKKI